MIVSPFDQDGTTGPTTIKPTFRPKAEYRNQHGALVREWGDPMQYGTPAKKIGDTTLETGDDNE